MSIKLKFGYSFIYSFIHSFIHSAVCLTTGLKHLPKRALHIVGSRASSFRCEYCLLSLRPSSSFLRLLPRLTVTSIPPFTFPSIACHRRQFLYKMWAIQLTFRLLISCRIFLCSLTLSNTSFITIDVSSWSSPSFSSTAFQNFPGVSDLLPEASKFQYHIKLYSICSILLVSSSVPSPFC
jgi:hypothetical protein